MLGQAWPATAILVLTSLAGSYLAGIMIGLWQVRASRRTDTTLSTLSVTLFAMPGYWLAVLLVWLFAYQLRLLPAFGAQGLDADFLGPGARLVDQAAPPRPPLHTDPHRCGWGRPLVRGALST
jgi:peptide/nickel transport system permease protein